MAFYSDEPTTEMSSAKSTRNGTTTRTYVCSSTIAKLLATAVALNGRPISSGQDLWAR